MAGSTLSGSGASSAPSAAVATQAAGGSSSQDDVIAKTGMTAEQQQAAEDFENYGKYQYKEAVMKKAVEDMKKSSGGSSSETEEPTVVHLTPYITKETSDALKSSNGNMTIQMNPEVYDGKTITVYEKTSSASSAGDDASITVDRFNGKVPDVVANSQSRTVTNDMIIDDYEKPGAMEIYQQGLKATSAVPVIGSIAKTTETFTINPKTGEFDVAAPFVSEIAEGRLNEWNEYDGSGKDRAASAMDAFLSVGTTAASFGVGVGIGAGIKGLSVGLGKLTTTKAAPVVAKVTNPLVKSGSSKISQAVSKFSSPLNLAANTANTVFTVDTVKTIIDNPKEGINVVAQIPFAIAGGAVGYKVASKVQGAIKTKGLTYIPEEKFTVEGIPLSDKLTQDNLKISFEENKFYPKPDKIAETNKPVQDVSSSAKLPAHPDQTVEAEYQIYHATNKPFGDTFEVAESQSEIKNLMYGAPKAETYFTRIQGESEAKPGLFFDIQPSSGGEILNIKGTAVKKIDYEIASRDLGISSEKLAKSTDSKYKAADYYVSEYGKEGEFYIPAIKAEYEAGPKAGTKYRRLPSRYYTKVNGVKVRISEYEPVLGESTTVPKTSGITGRRLYSYSEYSGKSQRIPVSYSQGMSSRLNSVLKGSETSASRSRLYSSKKGYSSKFGESSSRSYSSTLQSSVKGFSENNYKSQTKSISSIVYGGNSKRGAVSGVYLSRSSITNPLKEVKKKKDDKRIRDIDIYKAARRGRIDHLSLVDPLEFLGRGSLTNRNKADMTLYKEKIYLVDNAVTGKKPEGRRKK